jgi:hypothetical protein
MLKSSTFRHEVGADYSLRRLCPRFSIVMRRTGPLGAVHQESQWYQWPPGARIRGMEGAVAVPWVDTVVGLAINLNWA